CAGAQLRSVASCHAVAQSREWRFERSDRDRQCPPLLVLFRVLEAVGRVRLLPYQREGRARVKGQSPRARGPLFSSNYWFPFLEGIKETATLFSSIGWGYSSGKGHRNPVNH